MATIYKNILKIKELKILTILKKQLINVLISFINYSIIQSPSNKNVDRYVKTLLKILIAKQEFEFQCKFE